MKKTRDDGSVTPTRIKIAKLLDSYEKYNKWLRLFEKMLSIGEWISSSSIKKDLLEPTLGVYLWSGKKDTTFDHSYYDNVYDEEHSNISSYTELNIERVNHTENDEKHESSLDPTNDELNVMEEINEEEYAAIMDDKIKTSHNIDSPSSRQMRDKTSSVVKKLFKISKVEYALRVFMSEYKALMYGDDKLKLKTLKFHHIIHIIWYISKFGSPLNFDGSRPEAVSKETGKGPGRNTQHRSENINIQAATRFYENITISLAYSIACQTGQFSECGGKWNTRYFFDSQSVPKSKFGPPNLSSMRCILPTEDDNQNIEVSGSIIIFYQFKGHRNSRSQGSNYSNLMVRKNKLEEYTLTAKETEYYMLLVQILFDNNLLRHSTNRSGIVRFLSTISVKNTIFRASLKFYGDHVWFDWVNIVWDDLNGKIYPARLITFVDGCFKKKQ